MNIKGKSQSSINQTKTNQIKLQPTKKKGTQIIKRKAIKFFPIFN